MRLQLITTKECKLLKTIGIVTAGGDAPGMNAAIRAVTRIAHTNNLQVVGFERGWNGLLTNRFRRLTPRAVGGIIQLGGTMLYTQRCPNFEKKECVKKAAETLKLNKVGGLVVIGGDGSFRGALDLNKESGIPMAGIPATIDNDVFGTDETIGFDTAMNTAVNAIDKIRDTAISHERIFIVEIMGRKRGFLALSVGITVGAEVILIPETQFKITKIIEVLRENERKGKKAGIVVAAEGVGDTATLAKDIEKNTGSEVRLSILGYAQRGGSPTARSRFLASLFAKEAVDLICQNQGNKIVGLQKGVVTQIALEDSCKKRKPLDLALLNLAEKLAT
jgi:6-phosphofructokinase 1